MVLRPLTYIPESDSNDAKNDDDLDEANSKSVFDQSVLVDLDMNASMLEPDPAETKSSESEVASKENDASYQLELAKLEASVLGNKSIPDLVGDVQNPFKSDKQNLKRKLEANDILMKKKKM